MNPKNKDTDSGSYVNGVYTSKNGFSGSGLNCPRGSRLYDTNVTRPVFFMPKDRPADEMFKTITREVAPDVMDYYAISNHGRVMNTISGKVMKENFRPNGYGYYSLAAENGSHGHKKYSTHRLVMMTFYPTENMKNLEVNHKDGIRSHNYVDKVMPDGTIESNLEWITPKDNAIHRSVVLHSYSGKLSQEDADLIRMYYSNGYSYELIHEKFYPNVSVSTIQNVCCNRVLTDPNYIKHDEKTRNISKSDYFKITDKDAEVIRALYAKGKSAQDIQKEFYPNAALSSIYNVLSGKTHK